MTLVRLSMCAEWINAKYDDYNLLDAGCRNRELAPLLKECREYVGTDLSASEGVIACNLEEDLPFDDGSFDIVAVLDVLEHLNSPHRALKEILRVAKKGVFISLPNMYYIQFRSNFLFGKGISGKYSFLPEPVFDRHRWVMSYQETLSFVYAIAREHEVEHKMILPARGRTRFIMEPLERFLGSEWPNLFAYGALFHIKI